jgi:hypothetical protein
VLTLGSWGTSPFENERRLNLRTVSMRTKQHLAARANEMHNWELERTKDAMVEQSMDYADKQETLVAGIAAVRERASSERARNRASVTKVQDQNRLLEIRATEAGMEARSLRRQLEVQHCQTEGVQAVLEEEATDLRQELGQLREDNAELRFKTRGLLDELRIANSETEGVEARRVKAEKQKSYVEKKVTQLETTNAKITVEMQKLRKANRVLGGADVKGLKTMAGAEARAAQAEKHLLVSEQKKVLDVETKLESSKEELHDYKSRCHNLTLVCFAVVSFFAFSFLMFQLAF